MTGASWLDKRMHLTSSHLTSMFQERCATWFHSPQPPSLCPCLWWHHGVGRDRDCVWLLSVTYNSPLQGIHWAGRTSECWPRSESRGPQLPYGKTWSDIWNSLPRKIKRSLKSTLLQESIAWKYILYQANVHITGKARQQSGLVPVVLGVSERSHNGEQQ